MAKNPRLRKREWNLDYKKINLYSVIGSAVVCVLALGFTYMGYSSSQDTIQSKTTNIKKLKTELKSLEDSTVNISTTELQKDLNSASIAGMKVAELQNTWGTVLSDKDVVLDKDGNPMDWTDRQAELESGEAYKTTHQVNTTRLERIGEYFADQRDVYNWFVKVPNTISMEAKWNFVTVASFESTKNSVMWQYISEDGQLLAYVSGTYNANKDVFEDVTIVITNIGLEVQKGVDVALTESSSTSSSSTSSTSTSSSASTSSSTTETSTSTEASTETSTSEPTEVADESGQ